MNKEIQLQVNQPLLELTESCETVCVAGCCGVNAFDISEKQISEWVKSVGSEKANLAFKQLQMVIDEATAGGAPVTSDRFNACWSAQECIAWLDKWKIALNEAIQKIK